MSKQNVQRASSEELATHFEALYKSTDADEALKISNLDTNTYIPLLDDPINQKDLDGAMKGMKKGGYDYSVKVLQLLVRLMSPLLLLLFNIMFFVEYPVTLAKSLLIALPKKGNLLLAMNYRGIQMLAALGALYDRIIANRLSIWAIVSHLQSAFQKGKSTIHQLFTLRLLIETAKVTGETLYIGFFDLEKAFDKVSRFILLQKLVKLGIGRCMLYALKRLYTLTYCILQSLYSDSDHEFQTFSGIRQGASSSVLLFILFIDGLISYLTQHCVEEPLIGIVHCLLHADDTAVLSTDRDLFIRKCNLMLKYFKENNLSLNLSKSAYMIINGNDTIDLKVDILLDNGMLEYKAEFVYLGAVISDTGNAKHDITRYVESKRSNITIKYNNFIQKNYLAPLSVKLMVLDSCVSSSLVYGSEAWGLSIIPTIEAAYRMGIKRALGIRECVNNEIVYTEADRDPLSIRIAKQQLKFWMTFKTQIEGDHTNPLNSLIKLATDNNVKFLKYYTDLDSDYVIPEVCERELKKSSRSLQHNKIRSKAEEDPDSRLGVYFGLNPELKSPLFSPMLEGERIMITRYRCGSHNLKIETGRMCCPKIPREERLCKCNTAVQSLSHCLSQCPHLENLYSEYQYTSLVEAMEADNIAIFLSKMEKILKIY